MFETKCKRTAGNARREKRWECLSECLSYFCIVLSLRKHNYEHKQIQFVRWLWKVMKENIQFLTTTSEMELCVRKHIIFV